MRNRYLTSLYIIITLILGRLFLDKLVYHFLISLYFIIFLKSLIVMNEVIRLCVFRRSVVVVVVACCCIVFVNRFIFSFLSIQFSHVSSARWCVVE